MRGGEWWDFPLTLTRRCPKDPLTFHLQDPYAHQQLRSLLAGKSWGRTPNFVLLDQFNIGQMAQAVDKLNGF